jgi:hypothetical protein
MCHLSEHSWFTYLELLVFLQAARWPYQIWVREDRTKVLEAGATTFTCSWTREQMVGCHPVL